MANARVAGSFHTTGGAGSDIEAVLAEWSECEDRMNGHRARPLCTCAEITNATLDAPTSQAGSHCLAFSNQMSLSGKYVSGDIALCYLPP